jgi:hypothetical protein
MLTALSFAGVVSSFPTRQSLPAGCARAAKGHIAMAPPRSVTSSRLLVCSPQIKRAAVFTMKRSRGATHRNCALMSQFGSLLRNFQAFST